MVLLPKQWKSRSSPGIEAGAHIPFTMLNTPHAQLGVPGDAGWSSPVARQAHNLKVTGSNPVPATNLICSAPNAQRSGLFPFRRRHQQRRKIALHLRMQDVTCDLFPIFRPLIS